MAKNQFKPTDDWMKHLQPLEEGLKEYLEEERRLAKGPFSGLKNGKPIFPEEPRWYPKAYVELMGNPTRASAEDAIALAQGKALKFAEDILEGVSDAAISPKGGYVIVRSFNELFGRVLATKQGTMEDFLGLLSAFGDQCMKYTDEGHIPKLLYRNLYTYMVRIFTMATYGKLILFGEPSNAPRT